MSLTYKIWDFPDLPTKAQLFHVPGQAYDGGLTSGGARIISPEPGGRAMLEIQLSLQTKEWTAPKISWLISKINGEILRVQLEKTPQILSNAALFGTSDSENVPWAQTGDTPQGPWDNGQNWLADGAFLVAGNIALAGSTQLEIDFAAYPQALAIGHVIGVGYSSYLVDDIEYDENNTAIVTLRPPLRTNVNEGDPIYLRPYFTGIIMNGEEVRATYDIANMGHIQPGRIVMYEALIDE